LFDSRTGSVLGAEETRNRLSSVGVKNPINSRLAKKSPTFNKLLSAGRRVPYLGAAIGAGSLAATLLSGGSTEDKVQDFGSFFGGTAGAVALGALGSLAGGPLVGIPAGLLGYVSGEYAGQWLAQKILEEAGMLKSSNTTVPEPPNPAEVSSTFGTGRDMAFAASQSSNAGNISAPPPMTAGLEGYAVEDMISEWMDKQSGKNSYVVDQSSRSVTTGGTVNQAMAMAPAGVYDKYDFMNASRA